MDWRDGLDRFAGSVDLVHASPPCQRFSAMSKCVPGTAESYPDLVEPVRAALIASGVPYVIENVVGAPLIDPVLLCGTSFGLRVRRHRLFECSFPVAVPECAHDGYVLNPHNTAGRARIYAEFGRCNPEVPWRREMGVEWMTGKEAREAVPPVFTEYLGAAAMGVMSYAA